MNITMCSLFRNAAANGQIAHYFAQAAALRDALELRGHRFRVVTIWGDSIDQTEAAIIEEGSRHKMAVTMVEHSHGGPWFGSTEGAERLQALSDCGNAGLVTIGPKDDAVIWVESDLIWEPYTMIGLLSLLGSPVDLVAPLIFAGEHFYDVFVYRGLDGGRFSPFLPYHSSLKHDGELTEVSSAGSCLVMRGDVARSARMIDGRALLGFCEHARSLGFRLWVDASQKVRHPA